MKDTIKVRIAFAKERGRMAFEQGKTCIPAKDKFCMDLLEGLQGFDDSILILKAWISGWTEENLRCNN